MGYDLLKILPHKPPMILVDDIIDYDLTKQELRAEFRVFPEKLFYNKSTEGINSLVGIEIMAQTVGCYSYFKNGEVCPPFGLLLGTRLFNNSIDYFKNNEKYIVKVHEIFTDNQISSFDCFIQDLKGNEIQSAALNVCITEE